MFRRRKQKMTVVDGKPALVTFIRDKDGLSAKDFLLIVSILVFFGALLVGFISVIAGRIFSDTFTLGDDYFDLLSAAAPVVMVVVTGVMGVQGVEIFANRNKASDDEELTQEQTKEDDVI